MSATETAPATDSWAAQLEQLRARYKHVRPPVLAALNILVHDQNISMDDAKAHASLHGVRITAASVAAAGTLLSRMDGPPTPVGPDHDFGAHARTTAVTCAGQGSRRRGFGPGFRREVAGRGER